MTGGNGVSDLNNFLLVHKLQLEAAGVPSMYWDSLHSKLSKQIFDAGAQFTLLQVESEDGEVEWRVENIRDVESDDPSQIFLVDHAWTFQTDNARQQLREVPGLVNRMAALMDIEEEDQECLVESVLERVWRHCQTYSIGSAGSVEERQPRWYVMDEFGSRIAHSDLPSHRLVPFLWAGDGLGYSLLFPVTSGPVETGTIVTRDFLQGETRTEARAALLCAWSHSDMTNISTVQEEPGSEFWQSARQAETLPDRSVTIPALPTDRQLRVYSEYEFIGKNLTHPRFEITDNMADADILWLSSHFKEYLEFSQETPEKRINQFPCENVITIKDMLCAVARRKAAQYLPVTFNLVTELPQFVSYYQQLEKEGKDTHFIVKPWNLARALDTQVCSSLTHILRLPSSGPKIAQKYLHNPVLFYREDIGPVKFDIRYIILLSSVEPLKVYAYNRFWLRFANIPFSLDKLDVYEKHFTVMNYKETELKQMFCQDFIKLFEAQYPDYPWKEVEADIFKMLRRVFDGAVSLPPPAGLGHSGQSGAMYATDLMLDWDTDQSGNKIIVPKLLEFNWLPDCERACIYYPEFFNNVFSVLWLGETEGQNVTEL